MSVLLVSIWALAIFHSLLSSGVYFYLACRHKNRAQRLISLLYLFIALAILVALYGYGPHAGVYFALWPVFPPLMLTLIPVFYLYIRMLAKNPALNSEPQATWFHFLPSVIAFMVLLPYFGVPRFEQVAYAEITTIGGIIFGKESQIWQILLMVRKIIPAIIYAQVFYYTYLILSSLSMFRQYPSGHRFHRYLRLEIVSFLSLFFLLTLNNQLLPSQNGADSYLYAVALFVSLVISGFAGIVRGLPVNEVSVEKFSLHSGQTGENNGNTVDNSNHSGLIKPQHADQILVALDMLMQEKELFTNPKLKIEDIAREVNTNTKYLSRIIKLRYSENFCCYINRYRIKKAIQHMGERNHDHLTLDALSQSCGFVSRSSFISAFKRETGKSPSDYRKVQLLSPQGLNVIYRKLHLRTDKKKQTSTPKELN